MGRIARILAAVKSKAQRLLKVDFFYVALCDSHSGEIEIPAKALQVPHLLGKVIENRKPIHLNSDSAELKLEDFGPDVSDQKLPKAWLAVPMLMENQVLGVLVAENYHTSQAFGQTGVTLLSTIARQTAVAIDNARKGERLGRKMNALKAVNNIGKKLNESIELSESDILNLIDEQVTGLMDTRNMYIALYDDEKDEVRFPLMRVNGVPHDVPPRRGGQGRTEWIIENREPVLIQTLEQSKKWYTQPGRTEYIGQPFASWIGVPMIARNRVIGVIAAYEDNREHVYDEDDLEVLQAIAGQAATVFENARLYTKLRQANVRLEERTQELRQANIQLEERAKELKLLAVLGEVTAGFVHKMNNDLGAIPSYWLGKIESGLAPEDKSANNALRHIRENVIGSLKYIRSIESLILSRKIGKEPIQLKILLDKVLQSVVIGMTDSIQFDINFREVEIPDVNVNIPLLSEVFQNIIHNAVQAMPNGGTLRVQLKQTDSNNLRIEIGDTGMGISASNKENIFRAGFSTKQDGKGLGLWFSKAVVEYHEGEISFESQEGVGTTFVIILPIQRPPEHKGVSAKE
jgi:signal transduction histidine kinase